MRVFFTLFVFVESSCLLFAFQSDFIVRQHIPHKLMGKTDDNVNYGNVFVISCLYIYSLIQFKIFFNPEQNYSEFLSNFWVISWKLRNLSKLRISELKDTSVLNRLPHHALKEIFHSVWEDHSIDGDHNAAGRAGSLIWKQTRTIFNKAFLIQRSGPSGPGAPEIADLWASSLLCIKCVITFNAVVKAR